MNADKRRGSKRGRKKSKRKITLSKTKEMVSIRVSMKSLSIEFIGLLKGQAIEAEHLSELTEEEYEVNFLRNNLTGFVKFDVKYLMPFFTRRFTEQVNIILILLF